MIVNANESQSIMPSGTQTIPSTCDDIRNKIPPAYEEQSNNTLSSLEIRSIPNASDHAYIEASSSSITAPSLTLSSSAANDSSVLTAEQRQTNH